jgi:histone deacetylase 6
LISKRILEAEDLLTYLWDNYIELNDPARIYLLGTNIGHWAITNWLKKHPAVAMDMVDKTFHFITDVSLQAVRDPAANDNKLSQWYAHNSLVFIAEQHAYWTSDFAQRPKKKFGGLKHSQHEDLGEMLAAHQEEVLRTMFDDSRSWIDERQVTDDEDGMEGQEPTKAEC